MHDMSWVDGARRLRDSGATYRVVAEAVGKCSATVRRALIPGARERENARSRKWRMEHAEHVREHDAVRREHTRERDAATKAAWYQRNQDAQRERRKRWYRDNNERALAYSKEWRRTHPIEVALATARRRARIAGSTDLGDRKKIAEVYRQARSSSVVRCYLCGNAIPFGNRHVDHVFPLSRGGEHTAGNLAIACSSCNHKKADKEPNEVGILL